MGDRTTLLVTGVGGYWGRRLATRLATDPALHLIGLDSSPLAEPIPDLDFIQADVRNPNLGVLLRQERVQVVCHLAFVEKNRRSEAVFDHNVMGTFKVFGACAEAGVRRIVFRSSTAVYGARPTNSAFLTEDHPLNASTHTETLRDLLEIEAFCNGFRSQNPGIQLNVLRFAPIVGPTADTPLTRFLRSPWTPILFGFDPMMQVIHEDDVVEALAHAALNDIGGVFNVAAEGPLPLTKLMALAGKFGVPVVHLAAYWGNPLLATVGVPVGKLWPIEPDYLRYPCVADLGRMRTTLGFAPRYTAVEALREFAGQQRLRPFAAAFSAAEADARRLADLIERRARTGRRPAARNPVAGTTGSLSEEEEESE